MFDKYQEFFKNNEDSFKKRVVIQLFGDGLHHEHKLYHDHAEPASVRRTRRIEGDYYEWSAAQNKWDKILDYSPDAPAEWGPGNYDGEIRKA